jgi:hypothetical protein
MGDLIAYRGYNIALASGQVPDPDGWVARAEITRTWTEPGEELRTVAVGDPQATRFATHSTTLFKDARPTLNCTGPRRERRHAQLGRANSALAPSHTTTRAAASARDRAAGSRILDMRRV